MVLAEGLVAVLGRVAGVAMPLRAVTSVQVPRPLTVLPAALVGSVAPAAALLAQPGLREALV